MTEMMQQVSQQCVLLDLSFSLWGLTRKVKRKNVQIETADGEAVPEQALRLSKRLVKCDTYDRIVSADSETRRRVADMGLPFRRGLYAVPMKLVERVIALLRERDAVRSSEVDAFIAAYDQAVEQARLDLGPLFRESDYPTGDEVQEAFGFRWSFVELAAAGGLKAISEGMYEAEKAKVEQEWQGAAETMRESLRTAFQGLVESLRERLGSNASGKPNVFRDSRVETLREWVSLFEARDVTGDGDLAAMVKQAANLLDGTSAEDLRRDPETRRNTEKSLTEIQASVATLCVKDAPKRKFKLDGV
jgi:hypothetical protein